MAVPVIFTSTLASLVCTGSSIYVGYAFDKVYLQVPTMASGDVYVQGSADGTTFNRIVKEQGNTTTVHADFKIGSATTQRVVPIPAAGIPYLKVENSSGCTNVVTTYKFICC